MFFAGVLIGASVLVVGGPVLSATQYISKGVPWPIVMRILGFSLPPTLALTFPMGVLLATLLGFGRLSSDSESVAVNAGGIPFYRIALPAIYLGLAASFVGYLINDRIAAYATYQTYQIKANLTKYLGESSHAFSFDVPASGKDYTAFEVHVEKGYDAQRQQLKDVTITGFQGPGAPTVIAHADYAGYAGGNKWSLINPAFNYLGPNASYIETTQTASYDLQKAPAEVEFLSRDPDTLSFHDLKRQIDLLKKHGSDNASAIHGAEVKLWSKVALPFASLVFAVVGSPIGLRRQRSSKGGWGLAIIIIFGYYVLFTVLTSIAQAGHLEAFTAAFLPNILGLIIGAYLCYRASL
jgi:lipopolysaccharide export system permease protein